jgi:hypothetical protein
MIADILNSNVVSFLNDNIINFPSVENCSADTIGLPRCVVNVAQEGEEVIGYTSRCQVTATLYIEAASTGAKALLTSGSTDLDIAFASSIFRQGCSGNGIVVDGVIQGQSSTDLEGEIWTKTAAITAFCHSTASEYISDYEAP